MYDVQIERRAEREMRALSRAMFGRIARAISILGAEPRPPGSRKLTGSERDWRIRIGDYRVVYEIDDAHRVVRVFRVRHRKDAYR